MDIDVWIETKDELQQLAKRLELPSDWHDADCHDLGVKFVGGPFTNAMCDESEAHIVIVEHDPDYTIDKRVTFAVNAANLFAWACAGRAYNDGSRKPILER